MKKILGLLIAFALIIGMVSGAGAAGKLDSILESGKIVMATSPDFAPVEFIDPTKTGQDAIVGSDIDLAKYIAEKLGVELVIETMDFAAVQAAVVQGRVDMAISGFAYTDERAEAMELSAYFNIDEETGQGLLVLKENAVNFTKPEDFAGKKVAAQNASLQFKLLSEQLPDAVPELITLVSDGVMLLINGKVDAIAVSEDNGEGFLNNYDVLQFSDFFFDFETEGNVLAVQKGETELIVALNEIIQEVNELGLYRQWMDDAKELSFALGINAD
jgi:polar amino acid transport system substrate-binding protein